jgi:hypothetical protein
MKAFTEADLKKIAYNCKKATFLIEKQQFGNITVREQMELKIHLAGCSICVTFLKQSALIDQMAQKLFSSNYGGLKLDNAFKEHLQNRINSRLDKN